jgi:hypothetical protein
MAGTFVYTEATNIIVVTDGTSGAPATFNDMYTADQAGVDTILNVAENGAAAVTLDYQIRPTSAKALKVKCVVASKTTEADYIFITGTDAWGAAQTEALDVSAGDGSYETTKRFATITNLDCSDNSAGGGTVWGDGTIAVTQDIFGVIWEYAADSQYKIDCNVDFGDGATTTYFQSTNEQVYFEDDYEFTVKTAATLELGDLVGDWGVDGSMWSVGPDATMNIIVSGQTGKFYMYASTLKIRTDYAVYWYTGAVDIRNSILSHFAVGANSSDFIFQSSLTSLILNNVYFNTCEYVGISATPTIMNSVHVHNAYWNCLTTANVTLTDILSTSASNKDYYVNGAYTQTTVDQQGDDDELVVIDNSDGFRIKQFTANIHVTDKDGADLAGVTVVCESFGNVVLVSGTYYKCIVNHVGTGIFADDLSSGKWEVTTDAAAQFAVTWVQSMAYWKSAVEFSEESNSVGYVGTELVTNGDFVTGVTGWFTSLAGGSTFVEVSGEGVLTRVTGSALAYQAILTQGLQYRVTFDVSAVSGTCKWTDNNGTNLASISSTGTGQSFDFTHAIASANLILLAQNNGSTVTIDNVSVKDVGGVKIDYKIWEGTSEALKTYSPHKFTFSHASYPDFVMSGIIVNKPLVWEIDMGQSTADLTAIIEAAGVNVTKISGDTTAADNLELQYDGTGLSGVTFPATQAQIGNISTGSASVSTTASSTASSVPTVLGTPTNTYADTTQKNATYHSWAADGNNDIEFAYNFNIGPNASPTDIAWVGYCRANNETVAVYARNWVGGTWEQVETITGTAGSTVQEMVFKLTTDHVDTGANSGNVRLRFYGTTITAFATDRILCSYTQITQSVGYAMGEIWIDTLAGTAGTVDYVNGTADNPVLTWADALTLSASTGIKSFHIANGSTITLTGAITNYSLCGENWTLVLAGYAIGSAHISGASVSGVCTGSGFDFHDCKITSGTFADGDFLGCAIGGDLVLSAAATYYFDQCFSGVAGTSTPSIDFGAALANTNLNMRHYSGGIEIKNMGANGTDNMSLEGDGQLVINASSVGGTIAIRGAFIITGETAFVAAGGTISDDARLTVSEITSSAAGSPSIE